jgi:predicted site-specific integrase-resolvase
VSKIYRINEFASSIGRATSTVRRWAREGKLTAKRLPSGQRYFDFAIPDGIQREIGSEALAATLYFATLSLSNSLRPEQAKRYGVPTAPA